MLYTLRQPNVYRASASVIIDPQPPQVFGSKVQEVIQLGTAGYWSNQDYYNTQVEILKSYDLAKMTVVRNDLQHDERLVPTRARTTRAPRRSSSTTRRPRSSDRWTPARIATAGSFACT